MSPLHTPVGGHTDACVINFYVHRPPPTNQPTNGAANKILQNVLTVGSSSSGETRLTATTIDSNELQFYQNDSLGNIDTVSAFSSYGPTFDDRIKPEVLAPGDEV